MDFQGELCHSILSSSNITQKNQTRRHTVNPSACVPQYTQIGLMKLNSVMWKPMVVAIHQLTRQSNKRKSAFHKICIIWYHISSIETCPKWYIIVECLRCSHTADSKVQTKFNHNFSIWLVCEKQPTSFKVSHSIQNKFATLEKWSHAFCRYTPDKFIACFRQPNEELRVRGEKCG